VDIQQIIDEITTCECVNCKFGKALIALKSLRDDHAPEEKILLPQPRRSNCQGKTAKAKPTKVAKKAGTPRGNKRAAILDYLQQHPGSGAVAIAKSLGFSRSAMTWNLAEARDAGLVKIEGRAANAKWSLANHSSALKNTPPIAHDEEESELECKYCNEQCASPERLQRHLRIVHGK
jgi:hypothetical protein